MNLKILAWLTIVVLSVAIVYGIYDNGYDAGRNDLLAEQRDAAKKIQDKQATRQQANDSKAAAADSQGAAKTVTITQEVIKYVKTPGRNVCEFPPERVSIKSRAVDNANSITGFDDAAVQATPSSK